MKADISCRDIQATLDDRDEARWQGIPLGEYRQRILLEASQRNMNTITAAKCVDIYRGYHTAARRCEFYFRVVKTIFYERAQRVSKILFLTRENKIHIFKPPCNFLFII